MKKILLIVLLIIAGCVNVEAEKDTEDLDARIRDIERRLTGIESALGFEDGM